MDSYKIKIEDSTSSESQNHDRSVSDDPASVLKSMLQGESELNINVSEVFPPKLQDLKSTDDGDFTFKHYGIPLKQYQRKSISSSVTEKPSSFKTFAKLSSENKDHIQEGIESEDTSFFEPLETVFEIKDELININLSSLECEGLSKGKSLDAMNIKYDDNRLVLKSKLQREIELNSGISKQSQACAVQLQDLELTGDGDFTFQHNKSTLKQYQKKKFSPTVTSKSFKAFAKLSWGRDDIYNCKESESASFSGPLGTVLVIKHDHDFSLPPLDMLITNKSKKVSENSISTMSYCNGLHIEQHELKEKVSGLTPAADVTKNSQNVVPSTTPGCGSSEIKQAIKTKHQIEHILVADAHILSVNKDNHSYFLTSATEKTTLTVPEKILLKLSNTNAQVNLTSVNPIPQNGFAVYNQVKEINNNHKCSQCDLTFFNEKQCKNHVKTHFEMLQCDNCKKQFKNVVSFQKHSLKKICYFKKLRCRKCYLQCNSKEELKEHKIIHKKKKQFPCKHCTKIFEDSFTLKSHVLTHNGGKSYSCSLCEERFTNVYTLDSHRRRSHSNEFPKYECSFCEKSFNTRTAFKVHKEIHTTEGEPFLCFICGKTFKLYLYLRVHLNIHRVRVKKYQCGKCNKRFERKECLNLHMVVHTGEKNFKCSICARKFSSRRNLKRHLELHTETEQFHCKVCGGSFFQKQNLQRHLKVHSETNHQLVKRVICRICQVQVKGSIGLHYQEHICKGEKAKYKNPKYCPPNKSCQCDICGKIFKHPTYLQFHLNSHKNTKPYKCFECNRGFSQISNLRSHSYLHKGIKQYLCNVCGRAFAQQAGIYLHMRTHTGMKPYMCVLCKRSFTDIRSRKRHLKLHEEERLIECADCGMCFYHKIRLINHIQSQHPTKM